MTFIQIVHIILILSASLMIALILIDKIRLLLTSKKNEILEFENKILKIINKNPTHGHVYPGDHQWGYIKKRV